MGDVVRAVSGLALSLEGTGRSVSHGARCVFSGEKEGKSKERKREVVLLLTNLWAQNSRLHHNHRPSRKSRIVFSPLWLLLSVPRRLPVPSPQPLPQPVPLPWLPFHRPNSPAGVINHRCFASDVTWKQCAQLAAFSLRLNQRSPPKYGYVLDISAASRPVLACRPTPFSPCLPLFVRFFPRFYS